MQCYFIVLQFLFRLIISNMLWPTNKNISKCSQMTSKEGSNVSHFPEKWALNFHFAMIKKVLLMPEQKAKKAGFYWKAQRQFQFLESDINFILTSFHYLFPGCPPPHLEDFPRKVPALECRPWALRLNCNRPRQQVLS